MQKYENMKFDENLNYDDECGLKTLTEMAFS